MRLQNQKKSKPNSSWRAAPSRWSEKATGAAVDLLFGGRPRLLVTKSEAHACRPNIERLHRIHAVRRIN